MNQPQPTQSPIAPATAARRIRWSDRRFFTLIEASYILEKARA